MVAHELHLHTCTACNSQSRLLIVAIRPHSQPLGQSQATIRWCRRGRCRSSSGWCRRRGWGSRSRRRQGCGFSVVVVGIPVCRNLVRVGNLQFHPGNIRDVEIEVHWPITGAALGNILRRIREFRIRPHSSNFHMLRAANIYSICLLAARTGKQE